MHLEETTVTVEEDSTPPYVFYRMLPKSNRNRMDFNKERTRVNSAQMEMNFN